MPKKTHAVDENDFAALDQLARRITPKKMLPLDGELRRRWEDAKRGRPRKPHGTKAIPTMITVDPVLLRQIDAYAKKAGVSRSQFIANAARRQLRNAS